MKNCPHRIHSFKTNRKLLLLSALYLEIILIWFKFDGIYFAVKMNGAFYEHASNCPSHSIYSYHSAGALWLLATQSSSTTSEVVAFSTSSFERVCFIEIINMQKKKRRTAQEYIFKSHYMVIKTFEIWKYYRRTELPLPFTFCLRSSNPFHWTPSSAFVAVQTHHRQFKRVPD